MFMIVVVFLFIYCIFIFKWPLLSHSKLNKIEKMALSIKRLEFIHFMIFFIYFLHVPCAHQGYIN